MEYKDLNDSEMLYLIRENEEEAYNYVYKKYEPLINKFAINIMKKYKTLGIEYDDLFQEGMYGLSLAIKNFDSKNDVLFFTLAFLCIKREMYKLVIKSNSNRNYVLNFSVSLDEPKSKESDFSLKDSIYKERDFTEFIINESEIKKQILDLKYCLKLQYSLVFELKINGFSNKEIASLLDIKYKDVDNSLRSIKRALSRKRIVEYLN